MKHTALIIVAVFGIALAVAGCNKTAESTGTDTTSDTAIAASTEASAAETTAQDTPTAVAKDAPAKAEEAADAAATAADDETGTSVADDGKQSEAAEAGKSISETPEKPAADSSKIPGLLIDDLKVGDGEVAESGMEVTVHYTGKLTDGSKFDSSLDRGDPFSFVLGAGRVIKGWDQGVPGMKVGGKRKLTISPELGYGSRNLGVIPPNSTLIFEVELLGVKSIDE